MRLLSRFAAGCLSGLMLLTAAGAAAPRSAADRERDAREQPQAVLDFAGVGPGMQVADLFGGGGYWSELLLQRVGADGHVLLYNNPGYQGYAQKDQDIRFADGRLDAIERRVRDAADMQLADASLDRVVMVMAFHDLYWVDEKEGWPAIDRSGFIRQIVRALKPGGALLIVDHAAAAGSGSEAVNALHRIDEQFVRSELEAGGLRFESASELLRNADDARTRHVFDAAIRGHTDRFVHLYRKPG